MRGLIAVAVAVLLAGCESNPFKDYYHHASSYQEITGKPLAEKSEPAVLIRENPEEDALALAHSGHLPLGQSRFVGSGASVSAAKAFGAELGADLVVLYSDYRNTETHSAEIPMPSMTTFSSTQSSGLVTAYGTESQTFSRNVDKHEFMAGYWVKAKPKKWGLFTRNIVPSEFERLGTNKGVFVRVTVKGGPAHQAGLMRGDVLVQVGSDPVTDESSLSAALDSHSGAGELEVYVLRNGDRKKMALVPGRLEGGK